MSETNPDSIASMVTRPEFVCSMASRCGADLLKQCYLRGLDPDRFTQAAVVAKAEVDVAEDVAAEEGRLGWLHTAEEVARYRALYTDAFVAAYYDPEVRATIHAGIRRMVWHICYR